MIERVQPDTGALFVRVQEFARSQLRAERSPATIRAYQWGIGDFADYLVSRRVWNLEELNRSALEEWQDRLLACSLTPRSRSLATTSVRQFLKWAADHDYCDPRLKDWLASVRLRPLKPKPIPAADLAKLLRHFEPSSNDLRELRNRAMFLVFLTTGARVSEGLQLPRVGYERAVVRQKGGGEKLITVPDHVQAVVREYLVARVDESPHLFVNHPSGLRMTPGGVRNVWKVVTKKLGIAPFHTHQIRHTFATQLLAQGIDSRIVAELMGHRNMQSIMGYTEVQEPARQRAMLAIESVLRPPTRRVGSRWAAGAANPSRRETVDATKPTTDDAMMDVPTPADPRSLPQPAPRRGRPRFLLAWVRSVSRG